MKINTAEFIISNSEVDKCPKDFLPEYACIGRSNVGKSSLINMLTNHKNLAKTSGRPGKTQLINHFLINNNWFLVDLPGYGYAKVSKKTKSIFQQFITDYFETREQLVCAFVLIDIRHEAQNIDIGHSQTVEPRQAKAIRHGIELGHELRDQHPEIADLFRSGIDLIQIAHQLGIIKGEVTESIGRSAVKNAIFGYLE
jgi:ribosome biogenesis GTP-binding protein YsxC/EngB